MTEHDPMDVVCVTSPACYHIKYNEFPMYFRWEKLEEDFLQPPPSAPWAMVEGYDEHASPSLGRHGESF